MTEPTMDPATFGALSVAHYVALRELGASEVEAIKQQDSDTLARVSQVMSRVSFVDELRYSVQSDVTDLIQCIHRNSLETYLLCTCLDTLAGKQDYLNLQSWLRTRRASGLGISEKRALLQATEARKKILSSISFSNTLSCVLDIYNKHCGMNYGVRQLVQALPDETRSDLANGYTIYKESARDGEKAWRKKGVGDKLKTIFIDYLLQYRRNLYTHESRGFPDFGGICAMRKALRDGNVELPPAERHRFPLDEGTLLVTCHYGDEALFLRETVITCLAHRLGVLSPGWSKAYRKAERQKRMLYALLYELKHNIQIMQLHLQVLSEPLLLRYSKDRGSPKLETEIAQCLLDNSGDERLPIWDSVLKSYVNSALQFNAEIDKTGANTKLHMETTSQNANESMMKSEVRWRGQELGQWCMRLLEDYPAWTYAADHFPSRSF